MRRNVQKREYSTLGHKPHGNVRNVPTPPISPMVAGMSERNIPTLTVLFCEKLGVKPAQKPTQNVRFPTGFTGAVRIIALLRCLIPNCFSPILASQVYAR